MSPQQLLRETQRAAGNASLTAWHDTLISAGKDLKGLTEASSHCLSRSSVLIVHSLSGTRG